MNKTPEFAILQNSRTKCTSIWNGEEWTDAQPTEYDILYGLAKLMRTAPDPSEIVKALSEEARRIGEERNSE